MQDQENRAVTGNIPVTVSSIQYHSKLKLLQKVFTLRASNFCYDYFHTVLNIPVPYDWIKSPRYTLEGFFSDGV